jgi:hypothetical protein
VIAPVSPPPWIQSAANWLTPRRVRVHALILALCIWGVFIFDFATPGLFDRSGNIKFQDFLPFYISAQLIDQGRAADLYNAQVTTESMQAILGRPTHVQLPNLYGPQVALFFSPLARFSFPAAARIWIAVSLVLTFLCVYFVWKSCPALQPHFGIVALCALAYPPLFHFLARGQISALVLACFTAAFLAFRADRHWLAGIFLGFLVFKPQFLVAIPLVLLFARAWKSLAGLAIAVAAQLALARIYFGPTVMQAYIDTLSQLSRVNNSAELSLAPIQMHSWRAFWSLLIPWPQFAFALYVLSSIAIIGIATLVWKSSAPLALRYSALTLAAVLVNPHLFIYDLLVLAPALLLLVDWTLANAHAPSSPMLQLLLYLAFLLPLFGPLSRWTHLQLSVPVFTLLLCLLWRESVTSSHKLASSGFGVV